MFNAFNKNFFAAAAVIALVGFMSQAPASAQVVNSGAGSSSSNSQVTLTASIPSVVIVKVDQGSSTLSSSINPSLIDSETDASSQDFSVQGNVLVNDPSANVQCTVSDTVLTLENGKDTLTVNLSGTIGGATISEKGFTPKFSSRQAAIKIVGDLDETTVTSEKAPGSYTGTFTITASLL
jgi:hypothetical protein